MSDHGVRTGPGSVRFERLLPGPIERVWEYLTDPKPRASWFAGGPLEPCVGGRVHFSFDHAALTPHGEEIPARWKKDEHYQLHGRVSRCEPPHVLAYTWGDSEVSFELASRGGDVLLTLTHVKLAGRKEVVDVSAGWHSHLDLLAQRLSGVTPERYWGSVEKYEREYERRVSRD